MNIKNFVTTNRPYIAFGVGIVSGIASLGLAIRGTLKLRGVLDEYTDQKNDILETYEAEMKTEDGQEPPTDEEVHALTKGRDHQIINLKMKTAGKIVVLYLPSIGAISLSFGSFRYSVDTLRKWHLGATTALYGVTEAFDAYRERWIDEVGPEKERAVYLGLKPEKITVEEEDPDTGKTRKVKKEVLDGSADGTIYAYRWMEQTPDGKGTSQFDKSPLLGYDTILGFLKFQQRLLDQEDGVEKITLREMIKEFGFTPGKNENVSEEAEAIAGWVKGDVISVGFKNGYGATPSGILTKEEYNFLAGTCPEVTLCFNCRPDVMSKTAMSGIKDSNRPLLVPLDGEVGEIDE